MKDFIEQQIKEFEKKFGVPYPFDIKSKEVEFLKESLLSLHSHMIQEFEKMLPEEREVVKKEFEINVGDRAYDFGFNKCRSIVVEKLNNLKNK